MICTLCGHRCGVDRAENETGFCTMGETAFLSKVMLHKWEEPCISGTNGSGAIFFTGCSLRCAFCQNWRSATCARAWPWTWTACATSSTSWPTRARTT